MRNRRVMRGMLNIIARSVTETALISFPK
jgi:hypothetical protein